MFKFQVGAGGSVRAGRRRRRGLSPMTLGLSWVLLAAVCFAALSQAGPPSSPADSRTAPVQEVSAQPRDLPEILEAGILRHLGVPYANFVTGSGDGLDVELIQGFAEHLGVRYEYVKTDWDRVIPDLIGHEVEREGGEVRIAERCPVRGDLIANGLTVLPWRDEVLDYSQPTFPTQVWLIVRADSPLQPIRPSGDVKRDIQAVMALFQGVSVLCKPNTCLDPRLYPLEERGASIHLFEGSLNHLAPALINREADTTILDLPDALVALRKWPGKIKVIGPITELQDMAVGFPESSVRLREAFDRYMAGLWSGGAYLELVRRYYPTVFNYHPDYFENRP